MVKIELKEKELFARLKEVSERLGMPAYVVGGYVRDSLLGIPNDDIDIVVVGSGPKFAEEFSSGDVQIFKNFGTAKVKYGDLEVEFVGARKESYQRGSRKPIVEDGTLEDDLMRRDFTINALAASVIDGSVIDLHGGLLDLQSGLIRTPTDPSITFRDDPLRMLRCVRFAVRYGFLIEDKTKEALRTNAQRLSIISAERKYSELEKIITSPRPAEGFMILQQSGLLPLMIPELSDLDVSGEGHKNNFIHSLKVLENVSVVSGDEWLRWAALLHDIGKGPTAKRDENGEWTFYGHEYQGYKMVEDIFRRLKMPLGEPLRKVKNLVLLHMRPSMIELEGITDSAVRRLLSDAGDDIDDLLVLSSCDITTKYEEKKEKSREHFKRLREMIQDLKERDYKRLFQPCIDGFDLMNFLDLSPGPLVGEIKQELKNLILDGKIENERETLFNKAKEIYEEKFSSIN